MADLEQGADVFAFADDQLNTLVAAGALEPVENAQAVREANLQEAVLAAYENFGKLREEEAFRVWIFRILTKLLPEAF